MPLFPTFRRPCPYQSDLAAVMEGSWCRMCKQQVHDITDWTDAERTALLSRCDDLVCVSYRVPVASALAAAALVTSAVPANAAHGPKHHTPRTRPIQPPVITLAGAPMPIPPEPTPPPAPSSEGSQEKATPSADPQSSR